MCIYYIYTTNIDNYCVCTCHNIFNTLITFIFHSYKIFKNDL